jgi:hypothetical protein
MDLSSKEFALNFRGFEQDDPETVKRFTAFCKANFPLAPEIFCDTKEDTDTVMLTHGESPEALEALATVLREIGARVEVSRGFRSVEDGQFGGPSTQDLHRLFDPHIDEIINTTNGPACPYPPLGRTLYLLTQSDGVLDRHRLRSKSLRSDTRQEPEVRGTRQHTPLLVVSALFVCLGLLLATTTVLKREAPNRGEDHRSSFLSHERRDTMRGEPPVRKTQATRTLSGTTRANGFSVEVKVLISASSLSVSGITLIPNEPSRMSDGSMIKTVVGDPSFLAQSVTGEWSGRVHLAVFVDTDGRESHSTIPARVSVTMAGDNSTGWATLEIATDASKAPLEANGAFGTLATARLATLVISNLTLS